MEDLRELLKQKECAIKQLRREVAALRSVTPLLAGTTLDTLDVRAETSPHLREALRIAAPLLVDDEFDPEIRARIVESSENARHARSKTFSHQLRRALEGQR